MDVIIVGSGAVAAELTSYIDDQNNFVTDEFKLNLLGYLEFEENIVNYWSKYNLVKPVLSDVNSYTITENDNFLIGISDIDFRKKVVLILKNRGARIINFIHHTSIISQSAQLGIGNIIYPYCIVGPNTVLGDFNLITSYSFISHDSKIGNGNFLSTTGLGGRVTIGNNNFFGIRATVIPDVNIGNNNVIQAGMVVDKNIEDHTTVFHRFKEKVMAIPKNN